ncbi:MAG TPA: hypothetical protein VFA50_13870 [Stellaceae bacterium]|nr:hypothetical protein [Stellaceae bacterium]
MRSILAVFALVLAGLAPRPGAAQTPTGLELGLEGYFYSYIEPNFVRQDGPFAGIDARYTWKLGRYFISLDAIAAAGDLNYASNGTGRKADIWNYMGDVRVLAGGDLDLAPAVTASPYSGLGYRLLFDKAGGKVTTTGAVGYDRLSQYLYWPIGVTVGLRFGAWELRPNAEFDYLIRGWQNSYLTEVGFDSDLENAQHHGYGLRGALMAATPTRYGRLSFGPFIRYWNISRSESAAVAVGGAPAGTAFEPANHTLEAGLRLSLGF